MSTDSIALDIETNGLDMELDHPTVICIWSPTMERTFFYHDDTAELIHILNTCRYIYTFNGVAFDIPWVAKHCNFADVGMWLRKTVDPLFFMQQCMGYGASKKMDIVLRENGMECKCASGLDAIRFWEEERLDELQNYCMMDARLTYSLCTLPVLKWGLYDLALWENSNMLRIRTDL
jgi:DNA polymerase elongation subunit (family B)